MRNSDHHAHGAQNVADCLEPSSRLTAAPDFRRFASARPDSLT